MNPNINILNAINNVPIDDLLPELFELAFICERCGKCCCSDDTRTLTSRDISIIAKCEKAPLKSIIRDYTVNGKSLKSYNGKCKHYSQYDKNCYIYNMRPEYCRKYPISCMDFKDKTIRDIRCQGLISLLNEISEYQNNNPIDDKYLKSDDYKILLSYMKLIGLYNKITNNGQLSKANAMLRYANINDNPINDPMFRPMLISFLAIQIKHLDIENYIKMCNPIH